MLILIFDNMGPKPNGKKSPNQTKKRRLKSNESKAMGLHPKSSKSKKV